MTEKQGSIKATIKTAYAPFNKGLIKMLVNKADYEDAKIAARSINHENKANGISARVTVGKYTEESKDA